MAEAAVHEVKRRAGAGSSSGAAGEPHPGTALVRSLREQGFAVEPDGRLGDYRVTAHRGVELPSRPRLSLPDDLLTEYLAELDRTPGATAGLSALSLTEVHVEEALTSGVDGSRTTALGVRRTREGLEFFWHRHAPPEPGGRSGGD